MYATPAAETELTVPNPSSSASNTQARRASRSSKEQPQLSTPKGSKLHQEWDHLDNNSAMTPMFNSVTDLVTLHLGPSKDLAHLKGFKRNYRQTSSINRIIEGR